MLPHSSTATTASEWAGAAVGLTMMALSALMTIGTRPACIASHNFAAVAFVRRDSGEQSMPSDSSNDRVPKSGLEGDSTIASFASWARSNNASGDLEYG